MRNTFLSSKLKQTKVRLLIIDDNQIRYNQIVALLNDKGHQVSPLLLDDLRSFEKQLNTDWDIVLFGRAYDLKVEQALSLIHASNQPQLPLLLLNPENYLPAQYLNYINKGIYDLFNLDYPDRFYIGLLRTLSYSRAIQGQQHLLKELDIIDAQVKTQDSNKATALIQEGIHIQANAEYLKLFGLNSEDDIIGMPLLDILKPDDITAFKKRFKRISQNHFDESHFDIVSINPAVQDKQRLSLEFFPDLQAEAIQLTIQNNQQENAHKRIYEPLNRKIVKDAANMNAIIVFKLHPLNEIIQNFEESTTYLNNVYHFIQEQIHNTVIKLTPSTYVSLCQSATVEQLNSKLMSLEPLTKPQLIEVAQKNYPLQFTIGSYVLDSTIKSQEEFDFIFSQALATPLATKNDTPLNFSFEETEEHHEIAFDTTESTAFDLQTEQSTTPIAYALEQNQIHLKYQQLYDKQDSNLYVYEVTSGIIAENAWLPLYDLPELIQDEELSIKIDRWILVEACKQLNNFIVQYPSAKLIINLNSNILFDDKFINLMTKLLSIMSNAHKDALILQFNANNLVGQLNHIKTVFHHLKEQHIALSLRNFGTNESDSQLLQELKPDMCCLDQTLTPMLNTEQKLAVLQEKLQNFQEICASDLILPQLDDMNTFANAWNVDARYLQGNYFQKKLDHLIDIQEG